jgi:hypothetical protein
MSKVPSIEQLRLKNAGDGRKILNLYQEWDKSARKKDFNECGRQERMIKQIHERNGISET